MPIKETSVTPPEGPAQDCVWTYQGYRISPGNFTTAMVHLYRGELTRVNLWRNRLDTTTNWAVVTTAGALTFAFTSAQNPHFVLLLVLVLVLIFLNIEARRYTYYSLWYHRTRLLETEFFAAMLAPPFSPSPDWGAALSDALVNPAFPIPHWEAVGNRYRRNYGAIISIIVASWFLKLTMHPTPASSLQGIIKRAGIGPAIPGMSVIVSVLMVYLAFFVMALAGYIRYKKRGVRPKTQWQQHGPSWFKPESSPHLAIIVTNHKEEVAERLMRELERGVTALEGVGMYTGEQRDVLLCAVTDVQVSHLENVVHSIDEGGFVVVTQANDVRGRHFGVAEPPS